TASRATSGCGAATTPVAPCRRSGSRGGACSSSPPTRRAGAAEAGVASLARSHPERCRKRSAAGRRTASIRFGPMRDAQTEATADGGGTRVVVADDDVLLREGLASLLERSRFEVVGQAADGRQLLSLVREHGPELVIVDIRMPPTHTNEGLEAARVIREEFPDIGVVVLSAFVEVEHAVELLASGQGSGYLLKSRVTDVDDFVEALQRVARGGSVVDPVLVQELVAARR